MPPNRFSKWPVHAFPTVTSVSGDLEALPFADGSFEAVMAANSIQYADDRAKALEELAR